MRRPLVLVLACAAVGLVLALAFVARERADAPSVEHTRAVFEPAADAELTARAPVPAEPATVDTPHEPGPASNGEESGSPRRQHAALECDGPTIVVETLEQGGGPVAGAEVRWFPLTALFTRRDRSWFADPDAGERFVADGDGRVRVPSAENGARVHVIAGALVGDAEVSPLAKGDLKVLVSRVDTTHVRVLDAHGEAMRELRVMLRMRGRAFDRILDESSTTNDGRVALQHYPQLRPPGSSLYVEVDFVSAERMLVSVERESSPADPIVVRLPAVGSVRVAIFGAHGIDTDANGKVWLSAEQSGMDRSAASQSLALRDGVARAASIGLGAQLSALVSIDSPPWSVTVRGPGPVRAGEEALLALRLEDFTWIRFRMLDTDGIPIRRSSVGVQLVSGKAQRSARFPSDAAGNVRIPLTDAWSAGDARYAQINVGGLGQALVDLAREFPPGTTDLGDVHIGDGPRIAAGRVVDERGEPLSNARVQLVRFDNESQSERLPSAGLPRIATGLDGTFELIGLADPDVYGLRVTASGYVTARRPLVLGEQGIVIALAEHGSIRGNLVFTGELTRESVQVWLADGSGFARTIEVESKGFFRVVDVVPGKWELRVQRAQSHDVLARVGGIEVTAGGSVELDPIEVRESSEDSK